MKESIIIDIDYDDGSAQVCPIEEQPALADNDHFLNADILNDISCQLNYMMEQEFRLFYNEIIERQKMDRKNAQVTGECHE